MKRIPTHCAHCGDLLRASIMSRFNTDTICLPCERDEKLLPLYPHAVDAERAASRPAPSPC
jgi:hypothetical protein